MTIKKLLVRNMNEGLRLVKEAYGPDALILKSMKRNGKIELFVEVPDDLADENPRQNSLPKGSDLSLDGLELEQLLATSPGAEPDAESRSPSADIRAEYQNAKYRMLNAIGETAPPDIAPAAGKAPAAGRALAAGKAPTNERSATYRYQEPEVAAANMRFGPGSPTSSPSSPGSQTAPAKGSFDAILGSMNNSSRGYERTVASMIEGLQLDIEVAGRVRDCRRVDELNDALVKLIRTDEQPARGIRAFVGPSGSGKTTSLIKLITRRILQFGASSCAIINCDRYRAGASQQLDRMGELMDVEVIHLRPGLELASAINRVKHREFIAIDMPGLSMADKNLTAELQRLEGTRFDIQRYLVLPANLQANVMHNLRRAVAIALAVGEGFAEQTGLLALKKDNLEGSLAAGKRVIKLMSSWAAARIALGSSSPCMGG